MTGAAAVLAEVRERGITICRVGDRIRCRPAEAIPPDLLARLREHRTELLLLVPESPSAPPPPPAPDPERYTQLYHAFAGDCGTEEDLAACDWFCQLNPHLVDEIPTLEHACTELAHAGASADAYRSAVKRLASRIRDIRSFYRSRWEARAHHPPVSSEDLIVAIGPPYVLCESEEYWPVPVRGLFLCRHCQDPPVPSAQPTRTTEGGATPRPLKKRKERS